MSTIKLSQFGGMIPMLGDTNLPENAAALARNCYLYSGGVSGFRVWQTVKSLANASTARVFRIPAETSRLDAATFEQSTWIEFPNANTDIIRSFLKDDAYARFYWASATDVPRYNTKTRMLSGDPSFALGVPPPFYAPELSVFDLNAETKITRSYVYTYVTSFGEEGPPSDPVSLSGSAQDVWTIKYTPYNPTDRSLTKVRIYRTITSSQGIASYFQVAEVDMPADGTVGEYQDTDTDTVVSAKNQLQSSTWFPPPQDLEGWVAMPNGILCGWRGKEIWFSEQYRPHAWNPNNVLYTQWDVVGLGVTGQTVIVCTEGYPAAVTGINPASMVMASMSSFEPCVARGSIVSTPEGVYYASPNGLILASQGQFINVTKSAFSKDKWQSSINLPLLRATRVGTGYYGFGATAYGGFAEHAFANTAFEMTNYSGSYDGIFYDPQNPSVTTLLRTDAPVGGLHDDPWSGETLIMQNGALKWLDLSNNRERYPYLWRSKVYQSAKPENFEAFKVTFTVPSGETVAPTTPRDTALNQSYDNSKYGVMRVYADYRHIASYELWASGEQLRLPSGFFANFWQFEFEGVVDINSIQMATSAKELRGV